MERHFAMGGYPYARARRLASKNSATRYFWRPQRKALKGLWHWAFFSFNMFQNMSLISATPLSQRAFTADFFSICGKTAPTSEASLAALGRVILWASLCPLCFSRSFFSCISILLAAKSIDS